MNKLLLQLISSIYRNRTYYFRVTYDDRLRFKISSKTDFIREKQEEFNKLLEENIDSKEFIRSVLSQYTDFNYIVFSSLVNERFVQFAVINQELILDFPLASMNKDRKVTIALVKLLKENYFKESKNLKIALKSKEFSRKKVTNFQLINANFGKDIETATNFVESIFAKIYDLSIDKITVLLG